MIAGYKNMTTHDLSETVELMQAILDMDRPNNVENKIVDTNNGQPMDMIDYIHQVALGAYYEANDAYRMATQGSKREDAALLCQTFFKCVALAMNKIKKPELEKTDKNKIQIK